MKRNAKLAAVAPGIDQSRLTGGEDVATALLKAVTGKKWRRVAEKPTAKLPAVRTGKANRKVKRPVKLVTVRRWREPCPVASAGFCCVFVLPIRTENESNLRQSWFVRSGRNRQQTAILVREFDRVPSFRELCGRGGPLRVTMARLAPRRLDPDGNIASFKHIRDVVAWYASDKPWKRMRIKKTGGIRIVPAMGANDDDPRFEWVYEQESTTVANGGDGEYGVRIKVEAK